METLIATGRASAAVMSVEWSDWFRRYPATARLPFFARFAADVKVADAEPLSAIVDRLRAAALPQHRRELLEDAIRQHVVRVSKHAADQLDAATPFGSLGFDSLMALEVKTALERQMGVPLPVSLVWNYPTIGAVAGFIAGELGVDLAGELAEPAVVE
jgi:polyketide synthase 12/myxalamid-type polyketide synthase MxaB